MASLTSTTHPLRIDRVQTPLAGSLGLTSCRGKQLLRRLGQPQSAMPFYPF